MFGYAICAGDDHRKDSASTAHRSLLQPSTTSLMLTPVVEDVSNSSTSPSGHTPSPAPPVGYALGWFVRKENVGVIGGRKYPFTFSHSGGAVGACSVLTVMARGGSDEEKGCGNGSAISSPPRGVVVAVLFNLQEVKGVFKLGTRIAGEFYNL